MKRGENASQLTSKSGFDLGLVNPGEVQLEGGMLGWTNCLVFYFLLFQLVALTKCSQSLEEAGAKSKRKKILIQ